jgi:hypothetical protein
MQSAAMRRSGATNPENDDQAAAADTTDEKPD